MAALATFTCAVILLSAAGAALIPELPLLPRDRTQACDVTNVTVMLPMRDGVELNTVVFIPNAAVAPGGAVGTVLMRTPYGVSGCIDQLYSYACLGWAAVGQDDRGRFASQGNFTFWQLSANDAYDTMAAIAAQNWSNHMVASTGTSALAINAYVQSLSTPTPPPWLRSQFNFVGQGILHETTYQGGGYRHSLIDGWLTEIGEPGTIPTVQGHEAWDATYWNWTSYGDGTPTGRWGLINYPILHRAGWYDIFSTKQLDTYTNIVAYGGANAAPNQFLIVEPGGHCAGGAIAWPNASWGGELANDFSLALFEDTIGAPAASAARDASLVARIEAARRIMQATPVVWYVQGPGDTDSIGNFWVSAAAVPVPTNQAFFLQSDASLSASPPTGAAAPTTFQSLPATPVATYGGNNLIITPCGPQDQRNVSSTYANQMAQWTSPVLSAPVSVCGLITATLFVSTTANDTDFAVKLTDVFPTGEDMLVQDGIFRMRWRDGTYEPTPSLVTPGTVYEITAEIGAMSYIFNAGHAIRLTVSSSNFPRFAVNNNNGGSVLAPGIPVDAVNSVYVDAQHASTLNLPVIPLDDVLRMRV